MNMRSYSRLTLICAVMGILLGQSAKTSVATPVDITNELRTLDAFVEGLGKLERKRLELDRKLALTTAEFALLQSSADDLKSRVSGVQNALQAIARKLKAANQWNNLDDSVLAKITDSRLQSLVRTLGLRQTLERSASQLLNSPAEIHGPIEALRNKVRAQTQPGAFEPTAPALSLRAVRVGYEPTAAVEDGSRTSLRCRVAGIRFGLSVAVRGSASQGAVDAFHCFCFDNPANCVAL